MDNFPVGIFQLALKGLELVGYGGTETGGLGLGEQESELCIGFRMTFQVPNQP